MSLILQLESAPTRSVPKPHGFGTTYASELVALAGHEKFGKALWHDWEPPTRSGSGTLQDDDVAFVGGDLAEEIFQFAQMLGGHLHGLDDVGPPIA